MYYIKFHFIYFHKHSVGNLSRASPLHTPPKLEDRRANSKRKHNYKSPSLSLDITIVLYSIVPYLIHTYKVMRDNFCIYLRVPVTNLSYWISFSLDIPPEPLEVLPVATDLTITAPHLRFCYV